MSVTKDVLYVSYMRMYGMTDARVCSCGCKACMCVVEDVKRVCV